MMSHNDILLKMMQNRLESWFKDMLEKKPSLDDGHGMSIEFSGGFVKYSKDDEELFDITVKSTERGSL